MAAYSEAEREALKLLRRSFSWSVSMDRRSRLWTASRNGSNNWPSCSTRPTPRFWPYWKKLGRNSRSWPLSRAKRAVTCSVVK